jgi:hypothetical protein
MLVIWNLTSWPPGLNSHAASLAEHHKVVNFEATGFTIPHGRRMYDDHRGHIGVPPSPVAGVIPEAADHRRSMAKQRLCRSNTGRWFRHFFALWILTMHFSIGPTVCHVCCLVP